MKNSILFLVFFCFAFVAKGQNYGFSSSSEVRKNKIKSVLIKFYFDKIKSGNSTYSYQDYFDKSGNLIKRVQFLERQKKTIETSYSYTFDEKRSIRESITIEDKTEQKDSSIFITKNDSTFEQKEYRKGKLIFYGQYTLDASKRITKKTQIIYKHEESFEIQAFLRHNSQTRNDTSVVSKIIYLDSSKAYVKEYFNNNKKNYSEGIVYYNKYKNIEKQDITDVYPSLESNQQYVNLYIYDSNQNLTKVYRLSKQDFNALQKDSKAKVSLLDSDTYKYNDRNMLIEHTTFYEYMGISNTNRISIVEDLRKFIITYGYEYW